MFSTPFQPPQSLFKLSLSFKIDLSSILRSDTIGERTGEDHKQFGWLCWDDNTHKKHTKKVPAATNSVSEAIVQFSHDYLVLSSLGEGRCRDEACKEPFLSFEMRPFTTIAYRLVMDAELSDVSIAPDVGYLCCGGNPILPSGLPCHIEAQFLENTWDRSLPFPRVKDGSDNDVGSSTRKIKLSRQGASSLLTTIDIQSWNMSLFQTSVEILIPRMLQELLHGMSPRAVKAGFYKYWPYLDRSNSELIQMILTSNIHSHLANTGLYLTKNGFDRIESAVLPIDALRQDILRLLYDMLPLAQTPPELTRDLILSKKVKPKVLYPTRLRELLRANPSMSSNQPLITFEIAWALLAYCLTDLPSLSAATENEYHAKRTYKELIGCPLLPMADGSVRCFPKGTRDQVFKLPAALHVILPSMMPSTIHLKIDSFSPLFGSKIFLESVNISESCLEILTEVGAKAFPPSWRRCDAVAEWSKPEAFRGFVGRGINPNQGPSLELLMYVIWKDLLQDQDINTFRSLGDWPLLPVVSNNRKMLLKSQYLPFVFYSQSTAQSDSDRDHIQRELGRLTSIATNSAESQLKQVLQEDAKSDNWAWIHERVTSDRGVLKPLPSVAFAGSNVLDTTLPEAVLVPLSPREDVVAEIQLQQEMQMEDITIDEIPQTREVSTSIYAILRKVGVPFLDFSVLKSPPDVINIDYLPVNSRPSIARRILNSLAYFTQNNVVVYKHTEGAGVSAADSDLLLYDSLSVKERGDLLEQIYLDHQLAPLSTSEISQLKTLRLFSPHISTAESTSLMRGSAVNKSVPAIALSDYKSGAYWCSSTHTFDGMSMLEFATDATSDTNSSLRSAGANMPAVLVDEERLRPLYLLLNVLELTPALAARQFILPTLLQHSISPTKKLVLMMNFANK